MDKDNYDLVLAEYNTLRAEILQRIGLRYQLLAMTITAFAAILAFGAGAQKAILKGDEKEAL